MSGVETPAGGPWLVVGLGNPGPRYARNRHNAGAMVVDAVAGQLRERFSAHRSGARSVQARLAPGGGRPGAAVVLARPTSFMNECGGQVAGLVRFYKIAPHRLLVVHDDLDLDAGDVRLKRDGGEGGHNGLRSITTSLGTRDYCRLRLGIGRPPGRMDPADYVLRDFPAAARTDLELMVAGAVDAVTDVLTVGWERAQNVVNTRT